MLFILGPSELPKIAIGKQVTVVDYPDGPLVIPYHDIEGAIIENKQLGAALVVNRDLQLRREPRHQSTTPA